MAESVAAHFSYPMMDELGIEATVVLYLFYDPATTIANIVSEFQSTSLLLDAITGGKLGVGRCVIGVDPDPGVKGTAVAGSRVEQTGVFDFTNVANSRLWGNAIPALLNTKIVGGKINDADSDVVAWVGNLTTAVTTGHYTNPQDIHLQGVTDTFISFRKRRKQLHRESLSTS